MRNTNHDIWLWDMETDKASRKLAHSGAESHGKGHARTNTERWDKIDLD